MKTGASVRPTQSRKAAVSLRTCSGSDTLRRNRIRPHGSASLKNACSSAVSSSPAQPAIKARALIGSASTQLPSSVPSDEALAAGRFEPGAEGVGLIARHIANTDAIDRLAGDLGARDRGCVAAELRVLGHVLSKGGAGLLLTPAHPELHGKAPCAGRRGDAVFFGRR